MQETGWRAGAGPAGPLGRSHCAPVFVPSLHDAEMPLHLLHGRKFFALWEIDEAFGRIGYNAVHLNNGGFTVSVRVP
jgi:hypothetical protein